MNIKLNHPLKYTIFACIISCTGIQNSNKHEPYSRSTASVSAETSDGEIYIFYKEDNNVIIKKCIKNFDLKNINTCSHDEAKSKKIPIHLFKRHLKTALSITAAYGPILQLKIKTFNIKTENDTIEDLKTHREIVLSEISRIENFLDSFKNKSLNEENVNEVRSYKEQIGVIQNKLALLKSKQTLIDSKIANNNKSEYAEEINQLVDLLIDKIIDDTEITNFSYPKYGFFSKDRYSFDYNLLNSYLGNNWIAPEFAKVSSGKYFLRDYRGNKGDFILNEPYEIQTTELTQFQWYSIMGYNPSYFKSAFHCPNEQLVINGTEICSSLPVESVSYDDALVFIEKLNQTDDQYSYSLPTRIEWDIAVNLGSPKEFFFGDPQEFNNDDSFIENFNKFAWTWSNSRNVRTEIENQEELCRIGNRCATWTTHPVAKKLPNSLGLYDVYGNVEEWVSHNRREWDNNKQYLMGGCYLNKPTNISNHRWDRYEREYSWNRIGFRLVRRKKN